MAPELLVPGALALDMMYGPAARPFIAWAQAHGARGRDGLGMLVAGGRGLPALARRPPGNGRRAGSLRERWDETL